MVRVCTRNETVSPFCRQGGGLEELRAKDALNKPDREEMG